MHNSVKLSLRSHDSQIAKNSTGIARMKGKAAGIALAVGIAVTIIGWIVKAVGK